MQAGDPHSVGVTLSFQARTSRRPLYALSDVQTAVPTTRPTAAPADLTTTPVDGQLTVTWTALPAATGCSPVTAYNLRYGVLTDPPSGDWTDAAHDGTATTAWPPAAYDAGRRPGHAERGGVGVGLGTRRLVSREADDGESDAAGGSRGL